MQENKRASPLWSKPGYQGERKDISQPSTMNPLSKSKAQFVTPRFGEGVDKSMVLIK